MSTKPKLTDLMFGAENNDDIFCSYLDKETGKVHSFPADTFQKLYDDDFSSFGVDIFDEDVELAKKIENNEEKYVALPSKRDINEWEIMRDFCYSIEDDDKSQELLNAIHGKGAFRYFKDTIARMGIREDWFKFRDQKIKQKIVKWCERNDVDYIDDVDK